MPVTTVVPAACMGSGVGAMQPGTGDYDIMTSDPETVEKYGSTRSASVISSPCWITTTGTVERFGRAR